MPLTVVLSKDHAYPMLAGVASYFVHHMFLAVKVMKARKEFGVGYPHLYATEKEIADENKRNLYNCIQRGHQNALENAAAFNLLLLLAAIKFPLTAAGGAVAYLVGRAVYMSGYSTGKPKGRYNAAPVLYGGLFTLIGCVITTAVQLLRS